MLCPAHVLQQHWHVDHMLAVVVAAVVVAAAAGLGEVAAAGGLGEVAAAGIVVAAAG